MYLIKTSRESDGWNPFSLRVCSNFTFCFDLVCVEAFGCLMGEGSFMLFVNLLGLCVRPGFSGHLMPSATRPSSRGSAGREQKILLPFQTNPFLLTCVSL